MNILQVKEKKKKIIKYAFNVLTMCVAFSTSVFLWYWNVSDGWSEGYNGYGTLVIVGVLFCITYWFFSKMYQAHKIGLYRLTELVYSQFLAFTVSDVLLYGESVFWFHGFQKLNILTFIIILAVQVCSVTFAVFVCNRLFAKFDSPRKIMIVYGSEEYKDFIVSINSKPYRYNVVGCYSENCSFEELKPVVDECFSVYLYDVKTELKKELLMYCHEIGKAIYISQEIEELIMRGFDISHTFDIPFIRTKKIPVKWYYPIVKRAFDIVSSLLGLIVLSPVFLVVAILIKTYDGGPVFYKQVRLTKGHREFEIYKFRSMIVDAEKSGARLASQNDDRITPIGKFIRKTRIDELPQLLNILKGDMSVIGPRPERPEIEKEYLETLPEFALRLEVPAGLSGYAQVFGKYNTTPANKLKLDLLYISQRTLLLDFQLIFYTIKILFIPESTEGVEKVTIYGEAKECKGTNDQ